jgi:two-component system, chemotaxis family, CheB/CheR fusion protein
MAEDLTAREFTKLLAYLKASRGFDFGAYKVSSLMRRIQKRMREIGIDTYTEYTDYLEVHPNEFEPLFNTVLINVTSFFRDAPSWTYLAEKILPRLLEEREADRPIRVWSAGCASGEEAYTLAMLLAEVLGESEFRRAKIYATDLDDQALATARHGIYDERQTAAIPPDLFEKYFEKSGNRTVFRSDLRRCLIFGRHDLLQDAAISRLDLLVCRNTLMYFNAEAQDRIMARFHFALNRNGFLFLGKAETLLTHSNNFRPVDLKHRIFARAPTANLRQRLLALSRPGGAGSADPASLVRHQRLREAAFDAGSSAQIALDRAGYLVLANEKARRLFGLATGDLGRLLQDLEISYRPLELRSHLSEAYASRAPVVVKNVEWKDELRETRQLEVHIIPLLDATATAHGAAVLFLDQTHVFQLRADLERVNQELETAYEELQSANEELETTNEELQSTVEELETTNEELQSANEELETMNEELQSTNEELRGMNDQLQERSEELNQVNGYLASILSNLHAAVVVLDRDLQIKVWSPKAENLWGVRNNEVVGQSFLDLDIGLPVRELSEPLARALEESSTDGEIILDGINRRGRAIRCQVQCTSLQSLGESESEGVILLMQEVEGAVVT